MSSFCFYNYHIRTFYRDFMVCLKLKVLNRLNRFIFQFQVFVQTAFLYDWTQVVYTIPNISMFLLCYVRFYSLIGPFWCISKYALSDSCWLILTVPFLFKLNAKSKPLSSALYCTSNLKIFIGPSLLKRNLWIIKNLRWKKGDYFLLNVSACTFIH